jgi:hypothetical protein
MANYTMVAVKGTGQRARRGTPVVIPPAVRVLHNARPVPDAQVTFKVSSGGGVVVPQTKLTNAEGIAAVTSWTLGPTAGANELTAATAGADSVLFTATAT